MDTPVLGFLPLLIASIISRLPETFTDVSASP